MHINVDKEAKEVPRIKQFKTKHISYITEGYSRKQRCKEEKCGPIEPLAKVHSIFRMFSKKHIKVELQR